MRAVLFASAALAAFVVEAAAFDLRGTGDLGIVIERASGSVQIVETTGKTSLGRVSGLGDLSHATAVFSRDQRYGYVFGRDGGLTKLDLLERRIANRIIQAGNSIGGAISQDGRIIAVGNYEPGGVKLFDAVTLTQVADIPAVPAPGEKASKVVGLADVPGQGFIFSLYDAEAIWLADTTVPSAPKIRRYSNVGKLPYDGLVTPDGRHYIAGLFGEDGIALIDLWRPETGVRRILGGYGKGQEPLPVFKMPHLRGWAVAGGLAFLPAIGRHEVLVVETKTWTEAGRIPVQGQPVFVIARPDGRQVWVNFAHPKNDVVQVIDTLDLAVVHSMTPGKAIMHMEFAPRGEQVWISARDSDRVDIFETRGFSRLASIIAEKPSGILFAARANRVGF